MYIRVSIKNKWMLVYKNVVIVVIVVVLIKWR